MFTGASSFNQDVSGWVVRPSDLGLSGTPKLSLGDVNECHSSTDNSCDANATCVNTDSSFTCKCTLASGSVTLCDEEGDEETIGIAVGVGVVVLVAAIGGWGLVVWFRRSCSVPGEDIHANRDSSEPDHQSCAGTASCRGECYNLSRDELPCSLPWPLFFLAFRFGCACLLNSEWHSN